ncbi:VPEID-CTERM sorting domain-containing protein [Candidatus Methylocalor cossyra]|uniref:VPDSG-CTERM protein sorting domain-containing protein n=1 Tax=Candidatus Methylocalor cossyra TaxID=3108543 RepID=A0ABP1CA17_9GAMM
MKQLALVVAGALLGSVAVAGTITYDTDTAYPGAGINNPTTIPLTTTNWITPGFTPPSPFSPVGSLLLPKFDLPGQILDSVEVHLYSGAQFSYKIENTSPTAVASGTRQLTVTEIAQIGGTNVTPGGKVDLNGPVYNIDLKTFDGTLDFAGSSGFDAGISSNSAVTLLNSLGLAYYQGPGHFAIDLLALGTASGTLSGGLLTEVTTWLGSARADVVYTYHEATTPVPEIDAVAGTGALTLLAGMLALNGERRRRPQD